MKNQNALFPAKPLPSKGARRMASAFDNLVNGNLSDAKIAAANYPGTSLIEYALENLGWSHDRALRGVQYLKGDGDFQAYCDAN